jgi:hypothetical protein
MIGFDSETKLRIRNIIKTDYKGERYALLNPLVYYAVNMGINATLQSGKVQLTLEQRADVVRAAIDVYCKQDPNEIPLKQRIERLNRYEPRPIKERVPTLADTHTGSAVQGAENIGADYTNDVSFN